MTHRILALIAAGLLASLALPAEAGPVADTPAPIQLKYDGNTRESPAAPLRDTCPVHVIRPEDGRQNKETIGAGYSGPLLAGEVGSWVSDGLMQLKDFGFAVNAVEDSAPRQTGLTVKATVARAYTWQVGMKLFGMVALKAQFSDRLGVIQEKFYRAHGDKTNVWGADAEYVATLNYGLNNLLPVMAQDLVSLCQGVQVESYSYAGPDPVARK